MPTRRNFLALTLASGAALALSRVASANSRRDDKKTILILGGTGFLGPHISTAAVKNGHAVTLFNRGRTEDRRKKAGVPSKVPEGVEVLYGNRDPKLRADDTDEHSPQGLHSLKGRTWDAIIDTSGQVPRIVKASAELLAPAAKQYIYISSVSAYKDNSKPGADETDDNLCTLADPTVETMGQNFENYGGLKVLCEKAAAAAFPGKSAIVRPGLIVGPGDPTGRFTYWPVRLQDAKGDRAEVLCPGASDDPIQLIDARDLAEWLVLLAEKGTPGVFDAAGPPTGLTIGKLIDACKAASTNNAKLTWVAADFLERHSVGAWGDMPVWVPPSGDSAGFHRRKIARAPAAGLTFRPIAATAKDTLDWFNTRPEAFKKDLAKGLSPEREHEVLVAWHAEHN